MFFFEKLVALIDYSQQGLFSNYAATKLYRELVIGGMNGHVFCYHGETN